MRTPATLDEARDRATQLMGSLTYCATLDARRAGRASDIHEGMASALHMVGLITPEQLDTFRAAIDDAASQHFRQLISPETHHG